MKNLARYAPIAAVLGTVLFFAGCVTQQSARITRVQPKTEFTVVESSTNKELTPAQLDDLREAVADYLREQGAAGSKVYYVKISFPGENPGDDDQWAIVRIGTSAARTFTILAAYPGPDDYYPSDYYAYNAGFDGLAGYGGYYDPFDYTYGRYTRPVPRRDYKPDDRPRDKPDHPRGSPTRWDNNRPDPSQPRRDPRNPSNQPPAPRDHDRSDNPTPRTWTRNDGGRDNGGSHDWGRDRSNNSNGGSSSSSTRTFAPRNESPTPLQDSKEKVDTPAKEK